MMQWRRLAAPSWGVAVLSVVWGCGGTGDAARITSGVSDSGVELQDSASAVGPGDASTSTSTATGSPSDGGCLADILTFDPSNAAFEACWSCAKKVCASQLAACAGDCQCNSIVASALMCTEDGLAIEECFQANFDGTGDPAEDSAEACLLQQAYGACNCAAVVATDAGTAASDATTPAGGGGSVSGGGCSSSAGETSDGTDYEVSCSCPEGVCVCFGPTTHVVKYAGCPYCPGGGSTPVAEIFALCGFPPYP
jgi:hypothetical protein